MRIEYISHACLVVSTADHSFVTDPWWGEPCYARQWNVFPKPVNVRPAETAETVVISHAHADHLHEPTLRTIAMGKAAFYPFYWYKGSAEWLSDMGFKRVTEAHSEKTCGISGNTRLTYLVCGQDAIIVIEDGDTVLVDINDALHSAPRPIIELYCKRIKQRWPKIDYLFCGFGGASYYPNVFHAPDKDDEAISLLREEFFVSTFCRIVAVLSPDIAVPFAADFVLLNPAQRWSNQARFPREHIPAYFDAWYGSRDSSTRIIPMYPGDTLENGELNPSSPYHSQMRNGSLSHLIEKQYPQEVSAFCQSVQTFEADMEEFPGLLERHLNSQLPFHSSSETDDLRFIVQLLDIEKSNCFYVAIKNDHATVERIPEPSGGSISFIQTTYEILINSIREDWGGDELIIGYGCEVEAPSAADLPSARLATELLVRHPHPRVYLKQHPWRMLRYVADTWFASRMKVLSKLRREPALDDIVKSNLWLTESPSRLRKRLGLPGTASHNTASEPQKLRANAAP